MSDNILSDGDLMLLGIVRNCAAIAKRRLDADGRTAVDTTLTGLDAFLIRGEAKDFDRLRIALCELIDCTIELKSSEPIWSVIYAGQYFLKRDKPTLLRFLGQHSDMLQLLLFNASQTIPSQQR